MNAHLQPGQLFQTSDGRVFTLAQSARPAPGPGMAQVEEAVVQARQEQEEGVTISAPAMADHISSALALSASPVFSVVSRQQAQLPAQPAILTGYFNNPVAGFNYNF